MPEGYFVNLKNNAYYEVDAQDPKEAEKEGRKLLAQLILDGTIEIDVKKSSW